MFDSLSVNCWNINGGRFELRALDFWKLRMQEDSPGRREKYSINDRYSTPTQPKRLSASSAKQKAKDYAAKDNKSTRVLAKQAILKELSTQLFIRAQGLSRTFFQEDDKSGNQVKNVAGMLEVFKCWVSIHCGPFMQRSWVTICTCTATIWSLLGSNFRMALYFIVHAVWKYDWQRCSPLSRNQNTRRETKSAFHWLRNLSVTNYLLPGTCY